jgi:hypothetical protein
MAVQGYDNQVRHDIRGKYQTKFAEKQIFLKGV